MRDKRTVEISKTTPRQLIEESRQRLIGQLPDLWKNKVHSIWARNLFGENLTEKTAEQIYEEKNGDITNIDMSCKGYCQICEENFKLDEEFIVMTFSFCDEYGCGMSIHKNCERLEKL